MIDLGDGPREDTPLWIVSHFDLDDEEASFAIRCNGKPFHIDVTAEDLGDWPGKQEILRLLQDASEHYDAEESLQDLILFPVCDARRSSRRRRPAHSPEILFTRKASN
jgi:hypothetical protein